jgi:hypothetical protein
MPQMPTRWCLDQHREQLRTEFDAAVQEIDQARGGSKLTSGFHSRIGDSVFERLCAVDCDQIINKKTTNTVEIASIRMHARALQFSVEIARLGEHVIARGQIEERHTK